MKAPLNPTIRALFSDPRVRREYDKRVRETQQVDSARGRTITIKTSKGEVVSLRSLPALTPTR